MCMQLGLSDKRKHLNTFLAQPKCRLRAVYFTGGKEKKTWLTKLLTVHKRPEAKLYFTSLILLQCFFPPPPLCLMSKWEPHACIQRLWSKLRGKIKVWRVSHLTGEYNCLKWPHALGKPTQHPSLISATSSGLFLAWLQLLPCASAPEDVSPLASVGGKGTVFLLHV